MSNIKDLLSIGVDGTGTAGYVPKWLDANSITDSVIYESSGNIGIGTNSPLAALHINNTGSIIIPVGTTAQRPSTPEAGMIRFNQDNGYIEWYDNVADAWYPISSAPGPIASGGTVTDITQNGIQYRVHTFTSSGNFQITRGGDFEYFVVAGGGSSLNRNGSNDNAGGAGAGGVVTGSTTLGSGTYSITVGSGTVGEGQNGENSVFETVATAIGGGAAGGRNAGADGGSGGGGGWENGVGGSGTTGQGFDGGNGALEASNCGGRLGGGGGGAGGAGGNAGSGLGGSGGAGITSSFSGTSITYAQGGNGGNLGSIAPTLVANRGHGGSAVGCSGGSGDPLGSDGIVLIRYRLD